MTWQSLNKFCTMGIASLLILDKESLCAIARLIKTPAEVIGWGFYQLTNAEINQLLNVREHFMH